MKTLWYLITVFLFFILTGASLFKLMLSMQRFEKGLEEYAERELNWSKEEAIQQNPVKAPESYATVSLNSSLVETLGYSDEQQQDALVPGQNPGYSTKGCEDCYAKTCAGGPERPSRVMLLLINDLSFDTVSKVAKKYRFLKLFNKVPMLCACAVLGCLSGLN